MKKLLSLLTLFLWGAYISYAQSNVSKSSNVVRGSIIDKKSLEPIRDVIISVVGDTINFVTKEDGKFEIKGLKSGYNTIYFQSDGYKPMLSESFMVSSVSAAIVNVALEQVSLQADEVFVTASPLTMSVESPVSMRRIGSEEIDLTPGANRDISKVIQLSPGVVPVSFGNRNDVLVRGGGANENRYFLDGIEIPVLNHFSVQGGSGGYASLVNTDLLKSVNFYTGAFPAQFSNGLSSVMDMQMKSGNSERFHGKVVVGASDVGASIDTPISKNGKTTLLASYRHSYLQMLFKVLGLPFLPTYNDYQFKITSKLTNRDELYFIGLGSFDNNKLNLTIENPDESQRYILGYLPNNKQQSYVLGAGYKHSFKQGAFRLTLSRNYLNNELSKFDKNDVSLDKILDIKNVEADYRLRGEVEFLDLAGFRLTAGLGGGYGYMRGSTFQQVYSGNAPMLINFDNNISVWRYNIYATLSRRFFNDKLSTALSLRADGMTYSSYTNNPLKQLSPRFSFSYDMAPKWSISGSVGRFHQEPTYTMMGYKDRAESPTSQHDRLKYVSVNSYVAGIEFNPNRNSMVKVEGFYKQYSNMPISLADSLPVSTGNFEDYIIGNVPIKSVGKGRAYGAEFSYRNLDLKNTVINVSYTLMYSQVNKMDVNLNPIAGAYNSSSWDVRHILNITAIHKFNHDWSLGAKWALTGGLPYTPYDYNLSSRIEAWDAKGRPYINYPLYNTERSSTYHQLDLRVDKVWFFSKWRLGFYVDIQNIYNFKSTAQELLFPETDKNGNYVKDSDKEGYYKMRQVANSFGGTILPTLGLTIEF